MDVVKRTRHARDGLVVDCVRAVFAGNDSGRQLGSSIGDACPAGTSIVIRRRSLPSSHCDGDDQNGRETGGDETTGYSEIHVYHYDRRVATGHTRVLVFPD